MGNNLPAALSAGFAVAVGVGADHSCVRQGDDRFRCWGKGAEGRLGTGDTASESDPGDGTTFHLGAGFTPSSLALGGKHGCALSTAGTLKWCARRARALVLVGRASGWRDGRWVHLLRARGAGRAGEGTSAACAECPLGMLTRCRPASCPRLARAVYLPACVRHPPPTLPLQLGQCCQGSDRLG